MLCDREGRVYDVWISFGSMHEVRAFRERTHVARNNEIVIAVVDGEVYVKRLQKDPVRRIVKLTKP